ncbi:MAG: chorismate synthase [Saprospiraceae bacterium]|jgi:chorismate synthase|nr:chorismate synthase [Saprospiraceae bacterium]
MNSFGEKFRVQIYGESHGLGVGIIIDGIPPGIPIHVADFEHDLSRRRSGHMGTTTRVESDVPEFMSGIFKHFSTGAPINIFFRNSDVRSQDYEDTKLLPRPGHADFVAHRKFLGYNDYRGGGHFSGRLTAAIVGAGIVAKKLLHPIKIEANLSEIGGHKNFEDILALTIQKNDSIGGLVNCQVLGIPIGWGEPFFNSIESMISHLVFSIPAVKGIEFGSGFGAAKMFGSEHNDEIISMDGTTRTNYSGGINGGISNGNTISFNVSIKPTSSISKPQSTIDLKTGNINSLEIKGRHDVCIALRAPVVIEAMTAIALADLKLGYEI